MGFWSKLKVIPDVNKNQGFNRLGITKKKTIE
jgi:hypothetical protein